MNPTILRIITVATLPFILLVVALNLAHPFFHSIEGGSFDAVMPMLDWMAFSLGGGRIVRWSHRNHDHAEHY